MRVAVLGASGVAGRAFVPKALGHGHRLETGRVDIFDVDGLAAALRGCDAAVNLVTSIPRPGGRGDWSANDRIRRQGTAVVIEACRRAAVATLVQQSIAMLHCVADDRPQTEDDPVMGYGTLESAIEMESLVRQAPLDGRLVRGRPGRGHWPGRKTRGRDVASAESGWRATSLAVDRARGRLRRGASHVLERGRPSEAYIASGEPFAPRTLRSFRVSRQASRDWLGTRRSYDTTNDQRPRLLADAHTISSLRCRPPAHRRLVYAQFAPSRRSFRFRSCATTCSSSARLRAGQHHGLVTNEAWCSWTTSSRSITPTSGPAEDGHESASST